MINELEKLQRRLADLDPGLYARLQDERQVTEYLNSFLRIPEPEEALCNVLSGSCYEYLDGVLEEEFDEEYLRFSAAGILTYELINLVLVCAPVFLEYRFPENEEDRLMRYTIIGTVAEYLKGGEDGI